MRNARTLMERIVLSKVVEGELRTLDLDLHHQDQKYAIYVFDAQEDFEAPAIFCSDLEEARIIFMKYMDLIIQESAFPTESVYDFAQRIYQKLITQSTS